MILVKIHSKGRLNCKPGTLGINRCQLWRMPVPDRVHDPRFAKKSQKFIYENFYFEHSKVDLFCPNCNMFFHTLDDYHSHLLMMDAITPLMESYESYKKENSAIKAQTRRMSLHLNKVIVSDLMVPLIENKKKKTIKQTKQSHDFKTDQAERVYYDPSMIGEMKADLQQKIEQAKRVQTLNEIERSMIKKQASIENVRKHTQDRIKRLKRQIKHLESELRKVFKI